MWQVLGIASMLSFAVNNLGMSEGFRLAPKLGALSLSWASTVFQATSGWLLLVAMHGATGIRTAFDIMRDNPFLVVSQTLMSAVGTYGFLEALKLLANEGLNTSLGSAVANLSCVVSTMINTLIIGQPLSAWAIFAILVLVAATFVAALGEGDPGAGHAHEQGHKHGHGHEHGHEHGHKTEQGHKREQEHKTEKPRSWKWALYAILSAFGTGAQASVWNYMRISKSRGSSHTLALFAVCFAAFVVVIPLGALLIGELSSLMGSLSTVPKKAVPAFFAGSVSEELGTFAVMEAYGQTTNGGLVDAMAQSDPTITALLAWLMVGTPISAETGVGLILQVIGLVMLTKEP